MTKILIIGCGSIGERHLRCFQNTGRCVVSACDTSLALLGTMQERYGVEPFSSLDNALEEAAFDAAVICTPAPLHLPMALRLLKAGMHLLIEKPLATDSALVPEVRTAMQQSGRFVGVAYVYHFMPWVVAAREFLKSGQVGKPLQVSVVSGQHFPTFRPAYRDIYYARRELGGGAIQDALTHLANAIEWCIGPCTRLYCDAAHQALEGVTVEDTVNISARHGEVMVSYAMNQFQAANETTILFNCERGSLKIEGHRQCWSVLRHGETEWTTHATSPLERDSMFVAQALAFLDGIAGKPNDLCTLDEAAQTLRFNQAALLSTESGEAVTVLDS